jgi:hypothetical protein
LVLADEVRAFGRLHPGVDIRSPDELVGGLKIQKLSSRHATTLRRRSTQDAT